MGQVLVRSDSTYEDGFGNYLDNSAIYFYTTDDIEKIDIWLEAKDINGTIKTISLEDNNLKYDWFLEDAEYNFDSYLESIRNENESQINYVIKTYGGFDGYIQYVINNYIKAWEDGDLGNITREEAEAKGRAYGEFFKTFYLERKKIYTKEDGSFYTGADFNGEFKRLIITESALISVNQEGKKQLERYSEVYNNKMITLAVLLGYTADTASKCEFRINCIIHYKSNIHQQIVNILNEELQYGYQKVLIVKSDNQYHLKLHDGGGEHYFFSLKNLNTLGKFYVKENGVLVPIKEVYVKENGALTPIKEVYEVRGGSLVRFF